MADVKKNVKKTIVKKSAAPAAPAPKPAPVRAPTTPTVAVPPPAPVAPVKAAPVPAAPVKAATPARTISKADRENMIRDAAYFRAEKHGFSGEPSEDWAAAEREIDARLARENVRVI